VYKTVHDRCLLGKVAYIDCFVLLLQLFKEKVVRFREGLDCLYFFAVLHAKEDLVDQFFVDD